MPSVAVSVPAPIETVTVVASVRAAPFRVPVTVTLVPPAFSATVLGRTDNATSVDAVSLSVIVSSVPVTVKPAAVVVPVTEICSAPSPNVSFLGVSVKVAVPEVCPPASIDGQREVSVKSSTVV